MLERNRTFDTGYVGDGDAEAGKMKGCPPRHVRANRLDDRNAHDSRFDPDG